MSIQLRLSSGYLGIGFAISTAVAFSFGAVVDARAQDLNLQSQINILSPPTEMTRATPDISPQGTPNNGALNADQINRRADASCKGSQSKTNTRGQDFSSDAKLIRELSAHTSNLEDLEAFLSQNPDKACEIIKRKLAVQYAPISFTPGPQPTKVRINFPFNPTYETDILKKGNDSSPGSSFGLGGNVLVTTAGFRPLDLVALSAGEASARYIPNASPSLDTVTSYLAYQYFVNAVGVVDGKVVSVNENSTNPPPANMITVNTLAFGFLNQTAYTPTFHTEKADFFTPQITLNSQNIDLDEPKLGGCFSDTKNPAFCHYANLSLTIGQSFSDVSSQQNFNVAGAATLGWRANSEWTLALQTMATAKDYEHVVGGRRDLLLQVGPVITYVPSTKLFTFTLPVSYYKNYSTVSAAAWGGLVIMPTLSIAFAYPAN